MFFPGPLRAETAHQAIMFYLNPPRELYGEAHALDSQEYIEMKREAMEELQDRDIARLKRSMKRSAPKALDSEAPPPLEAPDIHKIDSDTPVDEPFGTQRQIIDVFRNERSQSTVSQPTISRAIGKLFDESINGLSHLEPMSRYKRLCDEKLICKYLRRIEQRMFPDEFRAQNIGDFDGISDWGY
jgi:hypothetical protein